MILNDEVRANVKNTIKFITAFFEVPRTFQSCIDPNFESLFEISQNSKHHHGTIV